MSSGWAAWPEEEMTYLGLAAAAGSCSLPFCVATPMPVAEGGRVEGMDLYVYGRVVAVGRLTKGETVRGTCWRRG